MISREWSEGVVGVLCVALLAFGCGGSNGGNGGGGGGGGGGGEMELQEFQDELQNLLVGGYCESIVECPEEQASNVYLYLSRVAGSVDSCVNALSGTLPTATLSFEGDIERGLIEYDGSQASACLEAIRQNQTPTCDPLIYRGRLPEPCRKTLKGTQPTGSACTENVHCQSGACDTTANEGECYGECVESAETVDEGGTCESEHRACDTAANLVCESPRGGGESTCQKRESAGEGEPCTSAVICGSGLTCANGSCGEMTLKAEGETCSLQSGTELCEPGLTCAFGGQEFSCEEPRAEGESCTTATDCEFGLYCGQSEECVPQKAAGESCEEAVECKSQVCTEGTCAETSGENCEVPVSDG